MILIIIFHGCKPDAEPVLDARGFNETSTVRPLVVSNSHTGPLVAIKVDNSIATTNDKGEFCRLIIDDDGDVSIKKLAGSFPPVRGRGINASPYGDILWQAHYTGCYFLDIESGKTAYIRCGYGEKVRHAMIINPLERHVAVMFTEGRKTRAGCRFVIYSIPREIVIDEKLHDGIDAIILFSPSTLLCSSLDSKDLWYFTDSDFRKTWHNGLTKWMSREMVDLPPKTQAVADTNRLMIIPYKDKKYPGMYAVSWSENGSKITASKLFKNDRWKVDDRFVFSPDQTWCYSTVRVPGDLIDSQRLVFFHVDTKRNNALSQPYLGGYTAGEARGAFFRHKLWGQCFLEQNPDYPGLLFIYRLDSELKEKSKGK